MGRFEVEPRGSRVSVFRGRSFRETKLAIAVLAIASATTISTAWAAPGLNGVSKIIGGTLVGAADPIKSTTVALMDIGQGALCTASIVADDLAITAAHCVEGSPAKWLKLLFSTNVGATTSAQVRNVVAAVVNPRWRSVGGNETDQGDIALIRFSGGIPKGYGKIKLLSKASALRDGGSAILAGYGITRTNPHNGDGELRKTVVKIAKAKHGRTEILFDQRQGRGACHGDSGGPAFIQQGAELVLIGVTSRGYNDPLDTCGRYGVYTGVTAYITWLNAAARQLRAAR